ncbi:MAG: radical SAM protein [Candidatus Bathyarchaeota archaeon]|nr:radical SAM protein [Candidatus Bathyarchaeota archaeon]
MPLISRFDPWRSSLCTCPPKLTFNPYSGCDHHCVYCYASSYIPRFANCRPKKGLLRTLQQEATQLKGETISIANSSDPYPRMEAETGLTRMCLAVLSQRDCKIQIITKSTLVTRDIDLLSRVPSAVSVTITTEDDATAKLIEPNAPPPMERLKTIETLISKGIPVSVRIDPIIPHVNDNPAHLIATIASLGVKHVTSSTYKVKPDNWHRFADAMPAIAERLRPFYYQQGEKQGGNLLLPSDLRLRLMMNIRTLTTAQGMKFGVCREGFAQLNTAPCDGSWLLGAKH